MPWVVFYDIRADSARTRVAKKLVQQGIRVQKSVFLVEASPKQIRVLVNFLANEIDSKTDAICAWPLATSWKSKQHCWPASARPLTETFIIA